MRLLPHELEERFADPGVLARATQSVPFFYYILEFIAFMQIMRFEQIANLTLRPFWPIFWVQFLGPFQQFSAHIFLLLLFAGGCVACMWYQYRFARILAFLGIFQYQAFIVSVIGQEHDLYVPLFVSFAFMFLPDVWHVRVHTNDERKKFLIIYWGAQAFFLITYTMSGLYKLVTAFQQYALGQATYFSPDAAALYAAYWMAEFQRTTILGPFIVEHHFFGWIGLMLVLYILLFASYAGLRPSLHKIWGLGIIFFHLATLLSIGIIFIYNTLFAALFLLNSPFAPEKSDVKQVLFDLPLLGPIARFVFERTLRKGV